MTDGQFAAYVVGLMRQGGWARVSVSAAMGHLGTDVVGVAADGRRWLVRCHRDASRLQPSDVHRFARAVRELRRGDVAVLVTAGEVPARIRHAAADSATPVIDGRGLAWWADFQSPGRARGARSRPGEFPGPGRDS
jgi:hypothetical protein